MDEEGEGGSDHSDLEFSPPRPTLESIADSAASLSVSLLEKTVSGNAECGSYRLFDGIARILYAHTISLGFVEGWKNSCPLPPSVFP